MQISTKGIELIKKFEGFRSKPYRCAGGVLTIGYGHTSGVSLGTTCTKEQATRWLKKDVEVAEQAIKKYVKVPLDQNMYDALVSFIYNVGTSAFKNSTLLKKLNAGYYEDSACEFRRWNKAGGKVNAGLSRRRAEEKALFLTCFNEKMIEIPTLKGYKGFSLVDGLKQFGYAYSFEFRGVLWQKTGHTSRYKGSSSQNTELLNYLKSH